jgi:hypothetical protein
MRGDVKRWTSPQTAARRAERAAKLVEIERRERRQMWLSFGAILLVSAGLVVAQYFWLKRDQEFRHRLRHPHHFQKDGKPLEPGQSRQVE